MSKSHESVHQSTEPEQSRNGKSLRERLNTYFDQAQVLASMASVLFRWSRNHELSTTNDLDHESDTRTSDKIIKELLSRGKKEESDILNKIAQANEQLSEHLRQKAKLRYQHLPRKGKSSKSESDYVRQYADDELQQSQKKIIREIAIQDAEHVLFTVLSSIGTKSEKAQTPEARTAWDHILSGDISDHQAEDDIIILDLIDREIDKQQRLRPLSKVFSVEQYRTIALQLIKKDRDKFLIKDVAAVGDIVTEITKSFPKISDDQIPNIDEVINFVPRQAYGFSRSYGKRYLDKINELSDNLQTSLPQRNAEIRRRALKIAEIKRQDRQKESMWAPGLDIKYDDAVILFYSSVRRGRKIIKDEGNRQIDSYSASLLRAIETAIEEAEKRGSHHKPPEGTDVRKHSTEIGARATRAAISTFEETRSRVESSINELKEYQATKNGLESLLETCKQLLPDIRNLNAIPLNDGRKDNLDVNVLYRLIADVEEKLADPKQITTENFDALKPRLDRIKTLLEQTKAFVKQKERLAQESRESFSREIKTTKESLDKTRELIDERYPKRQLRSRDTWIELDNKLTLLNVTLDNLERKYQSSNKDIDSDDKELFDAIKQQLTNINDKIENDYRNIESTLLVFTTIRKEIIETLLPNIKDALQKFRISIENQITPRYQSAAREALTGNADSWSNLFPIIDQPTPFEIESVKGVRARLQELMLHIQEISAENTAGTARWSKYGSSESAGGDVNFHHTSRTEDAEHYEDRADITEITSLTHENAEAVLDNWHGLEQFIFKLQKLGLGIDELDFSNAEHLNERDVEDTDNDTLVEADQETVDRANAEIVQGLDFVYQALKDIRNDVPDDTIDGLLSHLERVEKQILQYKKIDWNKLLNFIDEHENDLMALFSEGYPHSIDNLDADGMFDDDDGDDTITIDQVDHRDKNRTLILDMDAEKKEVTRIMQKCGNTISSIAELLHIDLVNTEFNSLEDFKSPKVQNLLTKIKNCLMQNGAYSKDESIALSVCRQFIKNNSNLKQSWDDFEEALSDLMIQIQSTLS